MKREYLKPRMRALRISHEFQLLNGSQKGKTLEVLDEELDYELEDL